MSIQNCIKSIINNKGVKAETAMDLEKKLLKYMEKNKLTSESEAALKYKRQIYNKAKSELATAQKYVTLKNKISEAGRSGKVNPEKNLRALLDYDYTGEFKYDSDIPADITTLSRSYQGYYSTDLINMMDKFRSRIPGGLDLKLSARLEDVRKLIKAIYRESIDDKEIADMASEYTKANSRMMSHLSDLGATVNNDSDWVPQSWDRYLISKAGKKTFVDTMLDKLDINRTHGGFNSVDDFKVYLEETYDDIVTNGLSRAVKNDEATVSHALGSPGDSMYERRSFQFKDADSFLEAHEMFGNGDVFENMVKAIQRTSTELALVRTLGPSYNSTFTRLNNIGKEAQITGKAKSRFAALNSHIFREITGVVEGEAPIVPTSMSNAIAAIRIAKLGASLGTAFLSSVSDFGTAISTARLIGASVPLFFKTYVKMFTGSTASRKEAAAIGSVIDSIVLNATSVARDAAEDVTLAGGLTSSLRRGATRASEAVIRVSGLARHTQVAKNAFEMIVNIEFAGYSHLRFDELPKPASNWLETTGITSSDWDVIRAAVNQEVGIIEPGGIKDLNVVEKWLSCVNVARRAAVPEPGPTVNAILGAGIPKNTIASELVKGATQLKSYVISLGLIQSQIIRNNVLLSTKGSKIGYMLAYMLSVVPFAILGVQLKQIADFKDLMDFSSPKLISTAVMQVLGIPGDIIQQLSNASSAKDLAGYLTGPVPALTFGVMFNLFLASKNLVKGNIDKARANVADILKQFIKALLPGQNLWYLKTAVERLIIDQINSIIDPNAHRSYIRASRALKSKTGQGRWWEKGEVLPNRFPKIAKDR